MKEVKPVDEPKEFDVLCGQDRAGASHPGNVAYKKLIDDSVDKYQLSKTKHERMTITRNIIKELKAKYGSRFIRRSKVFPEGWEEITDSMAKDKVSHAIRFACDQKKTMANKENTVSKCAQKHIRQVSEELPAGTVSPILKDDFINDMQTMGDLFSELDDILMWEPLIDTDTTQCSDGQRQSSLLGCDDPIKITDDFSGGSNSLFNSGNLFSSFDLIKCFEE